MNLLGPLKHFFTKQNPAPTDLISTPGLSELIDFKNFKSSARLRSLVADVEGYNIVQDLPSGDGWIENLKKFPEVSKVLREALKGRILVDLCSSERWSSMHQLAKRMGASLYVAVDKYWPNSDQELLPKANFSVIESIQDSQCNAIVIKADSLEFLSKIRSGTCCIALNGVDGCVINSALYHEHLAEETQRVVIKGGAAFGLCSLPLSILATSSLGTDNLEMSKDPLTFSAQSLSLCSMPVSKPSSLWEDYSPNPFGRLLIRRCDALQRSLI